MDAYERITRNAAEVVTEEEVRELAADPEGRRAYVGYEPSGVLHVGHMLTANKLIDPRSWSSSRTSTPTSMGRGRSRR